VFGFFKRRRQKAANGEDSDLLSEAKRHAESEEDASQPRAARKPAGLRALMMLRGEDWELQTRNLSASGILLEPLEGFDGKSDDRVRLVLIDDTDRSIHLRARISRVDNHQGIALELTAIDSESEVPYWELLGRFADHNE
jgi:hypothetical protein